MTTELFVRHYEQVADASPVPVLLYNVTMFTGVTLPGEAVSALARHQNIIGLKDSGSDLAIVADFIARGPAPFTVLGGSAPTLYPSLCLGAGGAVLAVAGVVPDLCARIYDLVRQGAHAEALALQRRLAPLAQVVGSRFGVPGLKAALDLVGLTGGDPPRAAPAPRRPRLAPRSAPSSRRCRCSHDDSLGRTAAARARPEHGLRARDARARHARARPPRSRSSSRLMDRLRGQLDASLPGAAGIACARRLGHRHRRHGDGGGEPRRARHARRRRRQRLFRRSARADARALRRARSARDGEWGRAIDPDAVAAALEAHAPTLVAVVHAETSTGVLNPVRGSRRPPTRATRSSSPTR